MQEKTIEKVRNFISSNQMLQNGTLVIAGVSGGADSMTMLDILWKLREETGFSLQAVHVNHGIRGAEADRDEKVVEAFCKEQGIPFRVYRYDVPTLSRKWKMGHEETGRKVRQEAFAAEKAKNSQKGYSRMVTAVAHNQNDLAETMIHHLARGTGLRGLAAIKPVTDQVIRPLLCLDRKEIDNYVKEGQISFAVDSSNLEDDYTRNRIRRHILPLLEQEVNEKAIEHMAETAGMLSQVDAFMEKQTESLLRQYARIHADRIFIEDKFFQKEEILQTYGIRQSLSRICGSSKDITSVHIHMVQKLYRSGTGKRSDLPYDTEALREYGGICLRKKTVNAESLPESHQKQEETKLQIPGKTDFCGEKFSTRIFSYTGQKILEKKYTKWFDCDKIKCRLSIRTRRSGDCLVVNQNGDHKKLTRCMIDDRIPREIRDQLPVIAEGSEVLWLVGGRISEKYKITSCTRNVLEIKYQGGSHNE